MKGKTEEIRGQGGQGKNHRYSDLLGPGPSRSDLRESVHLLLHNPPPSTPLSGCLSCSKSGFNMTSKTQTVVSSK